MPLKIMNLMLLEFFPPFVVWKKIPEENSSLAVLAVLYEKATPPLARPWPAVQMGPIRLTSCSQVPTTHTISVERVPCSPGAISWFHTLMQG